MIYIDLLIIIGWLTLDMASWSRGQIALLLRSTGSRHSLQKRCPHSVCTGLLIARRQIGHTCLFKRGWTYTASCCGISVYITASLGYSLSQCITIVVKRILNQCRKIHNEKAIWLNIVWCWVCHGIISARLGRFFCLFVCLFVLCFFFGFFFAFCLCKLNL